MNVFQQPITINGNVFFASDFHLGVPDKEASDRRERKIVSWLESLKGRCTHLFLLGDIFDYWFEYKDVVPRGFFLFFAKLHELHEQGTTIYYFTGNHDMWARDYFVQSFGAIIFKKQQSFIINGKKCLIGHGDGLGPKDYGYKFIKAVFSLRLNRLLYGCIHPRHSFAIARFFSRKSRSLSSSKKGHYLGDDKEFIVIYCNEVVKNEPIDYFIYGHRHLVMEKNIGDHAIYFNIGDWISHYSYLEFPQEGKPLLKTYSANPD